MAKRFTDSEKWKRPWFTALPHIAKFIWGYLTDDCDSRGVWLANFKRLEFDTGVKVTHEDLGSWFGAKLVRMDEDKYFIPSFVVFQYGKLNPLNNAHKPVVKLLEERPDLNVSNEIKISPSLAPPEGLPSPCEGAQDKDKDKERFLSIKSNPTISDGIKTEYLVECIEQWGKTLTRFGVRKDPKFDEEQIARLLNRHGYEKTFLALLGAAFETKTDTFDPAKHVSIMRLQRIEIFEKCVNLGAQNQAPTREIAEVVIA